MSEGQWLWVLVLLFYISECCYWVPRGAVVWRAGRRWRTAAGEIGNDRGRLVFWNPLSEAGRGAVFEPWPFSVSPTGVSGVRAEAPNPGKPVDGTGLCVRWDEVERIFTDGYRVIVNDRMLACCSSEKAAHEHAVFLRSVWKAEAGERGRLIRERLEEALDREKVGERWERFAGEARWARFFCSLVGWWMFLWVPGVYWWFGDGSEVLAVVGLMWLSMMLSAVLCFRLQRRWFPEERGARWQHLLVSVLAPPHAARGVEAVSRNVMAGFHPLGPVDGEDEMGKRNFAAAVRDLRFPVAGRDDEVVVKFRDAYLTPVAEAAGAGRGVVLAEVTAEPAEREDGSDRYCPRCHSCYVESVDRCADCEGIRLVMFS